MTTKAQTASTIIASYSSHFASMGETLANTGRIGTALKQDAAQLFETVKDQDKAAAMLRDATAKLALDFITADKRPEGVTSKDSAYIEWKSRFARNVRTPIATVNTLLADVGLKMSAADSGVVTVKEAKPADKTLAIDSAAKAIGRCKQDGDGAQPFEDCKKLVLAMRAVGFTGAMIKDVIENA